MRGRIGSTLALVSVIGGRRIAFLLQAIAHQSQQIRPTKPHSIAIEPHPDSVLLTSTFTPAYARPVAWVPVPCPRRPPMAMPRSASKPYAETLSLASNV